MPLRHQMKRSPARGATWLRKILSAQKATPPSSTPLTSARKLTPIDHVLARVGREPYAPD